MGYYRSGYEDYGQLLRMLSQISHQSCIILTSREKPKECALLAGDRQVRDLRLTSLNSTEGHKLFRHQGEFTGTEAEWDNLIEYYAGNPLALKLVASVTKNCLTAELKRF